MVPSGSTTTLQDLMGIYLRLAWATHQYPGHPGLSSKEEQTLSTKQKGKERDSDLEWKAVCVSLDSSLSACEIGPRLPEESIPFRAAQCLLIATGVRCRKFGI